MKPTYLRLKGFKGILAGLGLEEIALDLSTLPPGLVAVTGPNGTGKTTLFDNLHPYRIMPYKLRKAKDWSPGAFSYYDQCYGDAVKELHWEMDHLYRSLILIDADRRKQEAYLYRWEEEWVPLNDGKTRTYDAEVEKILGSPTLFFTSVFRAQGAKNLSDYARGDIMGIVSELLGCDRIREKGDKAREVATILSRHAEAAQDRLSLLQETLRQGEGLEGLLSASRTALATWERDLGETERSLSLLGERIAEAETKKARADGVRAQVADLSRRRGILAEETAAVKTQTTEAAQDLLRRRAARGNARERLQSAEESLGQIEARIADAEAKKAEAKVLATRVSDLTERRANLQADFSEVNREGHQVQARIDPKRADIGKRREKARKILDHADEIRAKVAEEAGERELLALGRAALAEREEREAEAQKRAISKQALETQARNLQADVDRRARDLEAAETALVQKIAVMERDAAKLGEAGCTVEGRTLESCPFIRDAVKARDDLAQTTRQLEVLRQPDPEIEDLRGQLEEMKNLVLAQGSPDKELEETREAIRSTRKTIADREAKLAEIQRWTRLVPEMEQAEETLARLDEEERALRDELAASSERISARLEGLETQIRDLNVSIRDHQSQLDALTCEDPDALRSEREAEIQTVRGLRETIEEHTGTIGSLGARIKECEAKQIALEGQVADLRSQEDTLRSELETLTHEDPAALRTERDRLTPRLEECRREVSACHGTIGALTAKLEDLGAKRKEAKTLRVRIERLRDRIARWNWIARGYSNDGVISLEIDDAGPGISAVANDLLSACYGPRFSVRIETQAMKRDGGLKEAFDIAVFDAETGEVVSITEKSGGQVTWLEDAITRAICLYNVNGSGRVFGAMFTDEADGALDAERKMEFLSVKRRALELGTHEREFFISQTPDLVFAADARITLGFGGVLVQ